MSEFILDDFDKLLAGAEALTDFLTNGPLLDRLFPAEMTLKVISVDLAGVDAMINACLVRCGITATCRPGNLSKLGKYITWEIETRFETRADFHTTISSIARIDGVKYVL